MRCATKERQKRQFDEEEELSVEVEERPEASPRMVAVYRRADDTICHSRCDRPLSFQGVRAALEADFYCYTCLTHVTLPLAVLDTVPLVDEEASSPVATAS